MTIFQCLSSNGLFFLEVLHVMSHFLTTIGTKTLAQEGVAFTIKVQP